MSLLDQQRAEALIQLACQRFDPEITDAELQVLRDSASSVDLEIPEEDAPRSTIRPEFLRWLVTEKDAAPQIDPKGLRVYGYTIPGNLDLEECKIPVTLDFRHCTIEGRIILLSAETLGIYLLDSSCKEGILASWANIRGPLFLKKCNFSGEIKLLGAKITGQLNCGGAKLSVVEGAYALSVDGTEIGGDVFLDEGFESTGTIRFVGAKIAGQLNCGGAKLSVSEGTDALSADGAEIGGDVFLHKQFESTGTIRFLGAKISGVLNCAGAKLSVAEGTNALAADRAEIGGDVHLNEHFESTGEICFLGAKITGQLNCGGAKLSVPEGAYALAADGAEIGGDVFLNEQFESTGTICFPGAKITGNLECGGAKLSVAEGTNALTADNAEIGGDVFLNDGFESNGTIRLLGVRIRGDLACADAKLGVNGQPALNADSAEIQGYFFFYRGSESLDEIRLLGAQIGRDLIFLGAKIATVYCHNLHILGDLYWTGIQESKEVFLNLAGVKLRNLHDDQKSWPHSGNLILDGLTYEELTLHEWPSDEQIMNRWSGPELGLKVDERIEWLMRQSPEERLKPQPWMQLAKLLESRGDRKDAKHVIYRFRKLRAEQKIFNIIKFVLGLILIPLRIALFILTPWKSIPLAWPYLRHPNRSWSIAFAWLEEAPLRILYTISFSVLLGAHIFAGAEYNQAMIETVQTQPNAVQVDGKSGSITYKPVSAYYPKFQPFIYALENAIPLVKLGMDDKWMPNPQHQPQPLYPNIGWLKWLSFPNSYWFLMGTRWLLILTGWVQATIFVAAVADRFKK
jgi:hypothetical protein